MALAIIMSNNTVCLMGSLNLGRFAPFLSHLLQDTFVVRCRWQLRTLRRLISISRVIKRKADAFLQFLVNCSMQQVQVHLFCIGTIKSRWEEVQRHKKGVSSINYGNRFYQKHPTTRSMFNGTFVLCWWIGPNWILDKRKFECHIQAWLAQERIYSVVYYAH